MKFASMIMTTGTKTYKCTKVVEAEKDIAYYKRDYITDVLGGRNNGVAIDWHCLNNAGMLKTGMHYEEAEMENFSSMCEVANGRLKGDLWFRDVIKYLFLKELPTATKENRALRDHNLINNAATIIFTTGTKETHKALKALIENILPGYLVKIIDGDETTNAQAEEEAKQAIKDYYSMHNNYNVIFITSQMANRSFSVPEIKNEILFGCGDGQKIARGLTPWKNHEEMRCSIIEFKLNFDNTELSRYLSEIAEATLLENATKKSPREVLDVIEATPKLSFDEYFSAGINPIRKLTEEELLAQMQSDEYLRARAVKVVMKGLDEIDNPDESFGKLNEKIDFNALIDGCVEGDNKKKTYANESVSKAAKARDKELSADQRVQYLAWLLHHKEAFNSGRYSENILANEFGNMSERRKLACQNIFNLDMNVICQIANMLVQNEVNIY